MKRLIGIVWLLAPLLSAHAYDALLVPLGNGALLCGMARWFKAVAPSTKVIGICAATAPSMANSWREQRVRPTPTANTIADGIAVREPIAQAVQDMHGIVDDVLLVSEANIVAAMRLCRQHAGLVLEPAGAVGLAALVAHEAQFAGQRVATVLCGSNITAAQFAEYTR